MKDFRFLDYHTEYSCEGSINKKMSINACFGDVFRSDVPLEKMKYTIKLYKGTILSQDGKSNACFLDIKNIRRHINIAKSIYPFSYRVISKDNYFEVTLQLKDVPPTFNKYLLSWVRYMYEFPYNVILIDAYKLKQEKQFMFESISNLFNLALGCYCHHVRGVHQVPKEESLSKRLTIKQLRYRINKFVRLNDIYNIHKQGRNVIPDSFGKFDTNDIEYWQNDKCYQARKETYLSMYKYTR